MDTNLLHNKSVQQIEIIKMNDESRSFATDYVSVEEPLEIRVQYSKNEIRETKNISVTMRTPGHDAELAVGFLFTEGIISGYHQIKNVHYANTECSRSNDNVVIIELIDGLIPQLMNADRNFYTTSSCGVCGKGSIASIKTQSVFKNSERKDLSLDCQILYQLPERLRSTQYNFSSTGGIHASGLFTLQGELIELREDVGRHNALDKLIGYSLQAGFMPIQNKILLLSGRASFELIQKAAMAGISVVAAIGAPSSLAVEVAKEFDITLIGFLKQNRMNIYHLSKNVNLN
ncbi:formate dehydrogenase accessory sulfurtransferase FdhD [Chryseobacterium wanjuense]